MPMRHLSPRSILRSGLLCLAATASTAATASPADPAPATATCIEPSRLGGIERVDTHAVDAVAGRQRYRVVLDPACPGIQAEAVIRLASRSGPVCADGRSAAITANAICGVVAIRELAPAEQRCFLIRDVRGFSPLRGNRLGIDLRRGEKRILAIEPGCSRIDAAEGLRFMSGTRDGQICGHPRDKVIALTGAAEMGSIARQGMPEDIRPCPIVEVLPGRAPRVSGAAAMQSGSNPDD